MPQHSLAPKMMFDLYAKYPIMYDICAITVSPEIPSLVLPWRNQQYLYVLV